MLVLHDEDILCACTVACQTDTIRHISPHTEGVQRGERESVMLPRVPWKTSLQHSTHGRCDVVYATQRRYTHVRIQPYVVVWYKVWGATHTVIIIVIISLSLFIGNLHSIKKYGERARGMCRVCVVKCVLYEYTLLGRFMASTPQASPMVQTVIASRALLKWCSWRCPEETSSYYYIIVVRNLCTGLLWLAAGARCSRLENYVVYISNIL